MKDLLAAELHPELVQAREAQNLRFDVDVAAFRENLHETFEDDVGRNSLRQQLVKSIASLFQALRRLLEQNLVGCFVEEALPVDLRDFLCLRERIFLDFAGFEHENRAAEIAIGFVGDGCGEFDGQLEILFLADRLK